MSDQPDVLGQLADLSLEDITAPALDATQPEGHSKSDVLPAAQPAVQDSIEPPAHCLADTTAPPVHCLADLITEPGAFSRLLVHDHLDAAARLALSCTCTAARDMLLATAEHAAINLHFKGQISMTRLRLVRRALQVRRGAKLPTKLALTTSEAWQLSCALALDEGVISLDELTVHCEEDVLSSSLLATLGGGCPNLRVLSVHAAVYELPSPEHFPKLQELSLTLPYTTKQMLKGILRTTAPYIKQLTHLALPTGFDLPMLWRLSPGTVGLHLRTLHLHTTLDDALLGLVLRCAPALQALTVHTIMLQSEAQVDTQTGWQSLQFEYVYLSSLARLPQAPGLQILCCDVVTLMCDMTSLTDAAAARLKHVHFSCSGTSEYLQSANSDVAVAVQPGEDLPVEDQPAALRVGLTLLRSWPPQTLQPCVELGEWSMNTDVMLELQGLPHWKEIDWADNLIWEPVPVRYLPLLCLLPASLSHVHLNGTALSFEHLKHMCIGAAIMPRQAPLNIKLWDCAHEVLARVRCVAATLPNVEVVAGGDEAPSV